MRVKEQLGKEENLAGAERDKDGQVVERTGLVEYIKNRMAQMPT